MRALSAVVSVAPHPIFLEAICDVSACCAVDNFSINDVRLRVACVSIGSA
jgi:hypothetical protein